MAELRDRRETTGKWQACASRESWFPGFAPEDVGLVHGAALERRPFADPLVQCFVFAEARIALHCELVVLQGPLRVTNTPVAEHEGIEVVVRSRIALLRSDFELTQRI